jgi:amino-acid N-acetyltransferase
MRIYAHPPVAKVKDLLAACKLPSADLEAEHVEHFFGCGQESDPRGVVGVELYGKVGLLRSLAVDETARRRGCGKLLVKEAEQHAARHGVQSLYLLTTTAEDFFTALGYVRVDRARIPEAIRNTAEFSSLCPSSSTVMVKNLAG